MKPFARDKESTTKVVGIWIRVSTEDQAKGESPEHHLERGKAYALARGWKVKEIYDLAGVSGKSVMGHAEAKRMLADVKRGHITGLIFSKLARLARNTKELLDFADYFRANNADLISLQESIDTSTPAGRLFYTMIAAMAQWEREETVDRTKASIAIRAKLGNPLGGPAPFGYQWKDKRLIPDPKEGPVRKLMYELFLQHRRKKTVVRLLNEAGHRTRKGAKFTSKTVTRLLQDPTAKGIQRSNYTFRDGQTKRCAEKPKEDWVLNEVEALVKPEVWEECNNLIEQSLSQQRRPLKKPVNVFAGIVSCDCGEKMSVPANSPKYVCKACRNKIPIEAIDRVFLDEIKEYSVSPTDIIAYLEKADQTTIEREQLLANQEAELQKIQREAVKLYQLYQSDQLDQDGFGKFHRPLEERRKQLEESIPRLQGEVDMCKVKKLSVQEVASEAAKLYRNWPTLETNEKREIVEAIADKIVVGKGEITISLCCVPSSKELVLGWRKGWDSNPR
jgi:site-specific DNA recombinase